MYKNFMFYLFHNIGCGVYRRKFPVSYEWEIVVSRSIARGGNVLVLYF
jgi:hypothetical protein